MFNMNFHREDTKTLSFFSLWLCVLVVITLFFSATDIYAGDDAFFQQTLAQINRQRAKANLSPVALDDKLMKISGAWATEKARAGDLAHRQNFTALLGKLNYSYMNENIYFLSAPPPPERVVTAWMNSPGHRRNLLKDRVDKIGLGIARGQDGYYVVFNGADSRPPEPPAPANGGGIRFNGIPLRR